MLELHRILQLLHGYIGTDKMNHEFVQYIIELLMNEPQSESDIEKDDMDKYYPYSNEQQNELNKIYRGDRSFTRKAARSILSRVNKQKIVDEIYMLELDPKVSLHKELCNLGIQCTIDVVDEIIADILIKMIENGTKGKCKLKEVDIIELYKDYNVDNKSDFQNNDSAYTYTDIDEDIVNILQKLIQLCNKAEEINLNDKPVPIRNKIPVDEQMFKRDILHMVNTYYNYMNSLFKEYQDMESFDYITLCSCVRMQYMKYKKQGMKHEDIFDNLVNWLKTLTEESIAACRIVIAYFVQNCEVFDDLSR